jgi:hypothetical protein
VHVSLTRCFTFVSAQRPMPLMQSPKTATAMATATSPSLGLVLQGGRGRRVSEGVRSRAQVGDRSGAHFKYRHPSRQAHR